MHIKFNPLQLDINTVAAGGGSMLFFRSGMFVVGPESAGANPGPACYGKGKYIVYVVDSVFCMQILSPRLQQGNRGTNNSLSKTRNCGDKTH